MSEKGRGGEWRVARAVVISAVAIAASVLLAPSLQVCKDRGLICENTASRKGYRQWFFGAKTGHWTEPSELERFMAAKHPTELRHRWTSYAGTGKNILGGTISSGHGRPGPIILFPFEELDVHVRRMDDAGRKALYDLLSSGDERRIRQELEKIVLPRIDGG